MACWKLCQRLYDNQDEDLFGHNVRENLDLCRDFCQSLFDVRQKNDEVADSILRVSFELNNQCVNSFSIISCIAILTLEQSVQRPGYPKSARTVSRTDTGFLYHSLSSTDETAQRAGR